jgi:peptidoglycan/LPS O-acetylase OafA/YrhL
MNRQSVPFRTDIQALRGFAVLAVLFYHAKISLFPAGYLGVDVFFVISGFLITRLIRNGLLNGTFRFSTFYFRRAKRLLPAAYTTFFITALIAPWLLTRSELLDFRDQMFGALSFSANIVLWRQSGYFEGQAELKPLLHIWSLAIEEQYYFLLPGLMLLIPQRFWLRGMLLTALGSYALGVVFADQVSATFYLLPTRAWELLIGSCGALVGLGHRRQTLIKVLFWPALITLLVLPMMPAHGAHPGPEALVVCGATLVILLRQHPLLLTGSSGRYLGKIGDISYALYLVHWPIFAFFNNVWIADGHQEPAWTLQWGLITGSLVLGYGMNRFIEEPLRHQDIQNQTRALGRALLATFSLALLSLGMTQANASTKDYAYLQRPNHGLGLACDFEGPFQPIKACRNGERPSMLVWGDSFAMQLVPGLLSSAKNPPTLLQATRSTCGPFVGLAPIDTQGHGRSWAEDCIRFNDSVISYLRQTPSIDTVVLSSPFIRYVEPGHQLLQRSGQETKADLVTALASLQETARALRSMGKRVVVVAPPPSMGFETDLGRCLERLDRSLPTLGLSADCRISMDGYRQHRGQVLALIEALPQEAGIGVIRFDDVLCDARSCRTRNADTLIYRDGGHLSHEGSVFVAQALDLVGRIQATAR